MNDTMKNGSTMTSRIAWVSALLGGLLMASMVGCASPASGEEEEDPSGASSDEVISKDRPSAGDKVVSVEAEACNTLSADGLSPATIEAVTDAAPAAQGGTLEDGTYVLTKAILYGASESLAAAPFQREKIVIQNSSAVARVTVDAMGTIETSTQAVTLKASELTFATSCPEGASDQIAKYSASSGGLVLYFGEGSVVGSFYARQ